MVVIVSDTLGEYLCAKVESAAVVYRLQDIVLRGDKYLIYIMLHENGYPILGTRFHITRSASSI